MDDISKRIADLSPGKRALLAKQLKKDATSPVASDSSIAVIGMGCRFPGGANNPEAFWELLKQGFDAVTQTPLERWDANAFFDPDPSAIGKANTRWGAYLDQVDQFDSSFFGIWPSESTHMDPQQRLLLEVAWDALEDAGQTLERLAGSKTAVFVGIINHSSEYYWLQTADLNSIDIYTCTGTAHSVMANRLSYQFDLKGPSLAVDTACSSSLVSVHLAIQSLRNRECDLALTGGVHLLLTPDSTVMLSKLNMMAPDGHCKTFDSRADGFVRGEGCGLIVLKRLSDAISDGDDILAIIRGSAVNQDGRSNGLTAPNGLSHKALIREALSSAGVSPSQISYVETHGTGTALGDPIEVEALTEVIGQPRKPGQSCFLGSVKTNIGHLEGAAGIAGLIKTILCLQHKWIPPHLHFKELNPHITLKNTPFVISTRGCAWPSDGGKRFAGVSSLGVGGTNAHIILEEADGLFQTVNDTQLEHPDQIVTGGEAPHPTSRLLTLSARSSEALKSLARSYQEYLNEKESEGSASLRDVVYSASVRRTHHDHRLAVVSSSYQEFRERLDAFRQGKLNQGYSSGHVLQDRRHGLVFVFSGQGPQWFGMGRELLQEEPVFREVVERCDEALRKDADWSLLEELSAGESRSRLGETQFAQPAIFALQVGLAALWRSWGVVPDAVIGHSVGEIAAAHVAGALTFEDAVRVIFQRGRTMQRATGNGRMASVELPHPEVEQALSGYIGRLSVAAVNSPSTTVVSGEREALDELLQSLEGRGVVCKLLPGNYAFHSPQMDPLKEELIESLRGITPQPSLIAIYSTVSGTICDGKTLDAEYWWRNVRKTVLFSTAIDNLLESGNDLFLELSPHPVLSPAVSQCLDYRTIEGSVVASLRRKQNERATLLAALGGLYTGGYTVDWRKFYSTKGRFVKLPSYPWQRKRFWIESPSPVSNPHASKACAPASNPLPQTALDQHFGSPESKKETYMPNATTAPKRSRKDKILTTLIPLLQELSGLESASLKPELNFMEMGLDSLFLTQASQAFSKKFGVKITIRQMMEELDTLDRVAAFLDEKSPSEIVSEEAPVTQQPVVSQPGFTPQFQMQAPNSSPAVGDVSTLERIIREQLQMMNKQLEVLRGLGSAAGQTNVPPVGPALPHPMTEPGPNAVLQQSDEQKKGAVAAHGPFKPIMKGATSGLTDTQRKYLDAFIERYTKRTPESKRLTQFHRPHLADPRSVSGFKQLWKEIVYPIVSARSAGSKIWDVDGNEYIDFIMGFGANLFGHRPPFVQKAIEEQLELGMEIGPQTALAGKVAELICEFTGLERAAFCNTGSEAVMASLRVARTVTGRDKVVMFNGDYHGMFDEVLVHPGPGSGPLRSYPIAPGIPQRLVENMLVLDYCSPKSLETLKSLGPELAAVLVEPVQSRYPERQPKEFLQEVRMLTEKSGTALIFDEMVTGFRSHPGGAQAIFNIKADLATYGKVIGGGLPIGILAGKAAFMDALDGGFWTYGDASSPEVGVTFFAGTFVRHPLAMASAYAVLEHLKKSGPQLQRSLNERTTQLVNTLNSITDEMGIPLQFHHFSSIFYLHIPPELPLASLLFYFLREKGIHTWENRFFVLTTAHTEEDLNSLVNAFRDSLNEMQMGGFLSERSAGSGPGHDQTTPSTAGNDHAQGQKGRAYTTSDFPESGLTQEQLDQLIAEIS